MATNFLWYPGVSGNSGLAVAAFNLMTTELNSLTSTSVIISSVGGTSGLFTNVNTAQAMFGDIFWYVGNPGIGSALAAGANLSIWFLTSPDSGTSLEVTTIVPPRPPDAIIPLPATTISASSPPFKSQGLVRLPALQFKVMVQNNTGQTLGTGATTANKLQLAPFVMQY